MKHHEIGRRMARMAVTGALTCGVAAFAVSAGPAYAAGTTRYVGAAAGSDTGCASPGYTTVQSAVNAASPGDTVYLCGTTPFREQVIITKSITLTGDSGATIAAPSTWAPSAGALPPQFASDGLFAPQALVVAWGHGVHVTISGLTVSGPLPGNSSCGDEEYGILVIDGASAQISQDTVTDIRDANSSLYGCQFGVGIELGSESWPTPSFSSKVVDFTGTGTITHTTISGYQKNGIVVDGPGSFAQVSDNAVTGAGPAGALGQIIAQNGIQVSDGASGKVTGNTVSANQYSGTGFASADGILVFGGCGFGSLAKNVSVTGNTLVNNDIGVQLSNSTAASAPYCNVAVHTRTDDTAMRNRISDSVITNVSGESTSPLCGYQAGVSDLGDHDVIAFNNVSGAGYQNHPKCTTAQPYVTLGVDTTGSIDPAVFLNP
jgi:Right handed beta helix region